MTNAQNTAWERALATIPQEALANHDTAEDALLWLVSFEMARQTLENGDTKDLAEMFLVGVRPLTKQGAQDWLENYEEDDAEGLAETLANFWE